LLKKPAKGGIPAIENSIIPKVNATKTFCEAKEVQFVKYFGIAALFDEINIKVNTAVVIII
jgi:hypothetical protein